MFRAIGLALRKGKNPFRVQAYFFERSNKLKEQQNENCANCKWLKDLPFSDEMICVNENSDYADCPCEPNDTCESWKGLKTDE